MGGRYGAHVDTRSEIREFLTSRRARITPEQAGLRTYGNSSRRVPGLRREEVALLAGVSVDYYTRLERGNTTDRDLSDLVGELSTRSELSRTLWAAHDVRTHDTGTKHVHHPLVGELNLRFEALELVADPGLTMFVYTAEPGSKSEQALNLLASWAATPTQETADADHKEQPRHQRRA
jgi:transcriptional regulator with XRE-family HTH domain